MAGSVGASVSVAPVGGATRDLEARHALCRATREFALAEAAQMAEDEGRMMGPMCAYAAKRIARRIREGL